MDFVAVGVAGFFIWWVVAYSTLLDRPLGWPREHWAPLVMCSFCAGFWITGALLLFTGTYDPLTHLAAAGLCGFMGGFVA